MTSRGSARALPSFALTALALGCAGAGADLPDYRGVPGWTTRAIPEARGDVRQAADGTRVAVRYKGWTTRDYGAFRTYAYDDARPELPVRSAAPPAGTTGDPLKGRRLFLYRAKGPCKGCLLVPRDVVWRADSARPDC